MTGQDPNPDREQGLARRSFVTATVAAAVGAAAGVAGTAAVAAAGGEASDASRRGDGPTTGTTASDDVAVGRRSLSFAGRRQRGIAETPPAHVALLALDLLPGSNRDDLRRVLRIWSGDAARMTAGLGPLASTTPELAAHPSSLTVTIGLGHGAFTAAGLEDQRPSWCAPLPAFPTDRLEERWSGGDLVVQVCADDPTTVAHTSRALLAGVRDLAVQRWVQRGFRTAAGVAPAGTTPRNLMGQVDGSRNLVPGTDDALIWHDSTAPAWLQGGTSMVLRRIAMHLDTWESVDRAARETVIGRRLDTGAPLTGTSEHDTPDLTARDTNGLLVIDSAAHVRRARTDDPRQRFLRRGYNYDDAPAPGALSDSGLLFVTFQRDPVTQFVPIQQRIAEQDLLNTWVTPVGSGVWAIPAGCEDGGYVGQPLLEG